MILVDSSVWIAIFRTPSCIEAQVMRDVIEIQAATCGVILQEVIQGIHSAHYRREVQRSLMRHHYLDAPQRVYLKAAGFTRRCRQKGIGLSTVDALIAAVSACHRARLWTLDGDLIRASRVLPVALYPRFS